MKHKSKKRITILITTFIILFLASFLVIKFTAIKTFAAIEFPVNRPIILTATILNRGNAGTEVGFNSYFQIATDANGGGTVTDQAAVFIAPLSANLSQTITTTYTFTTLGTYSIRACADTGNAVSETSETNNCGSWLNISIVESTSLPQPGLNICANGADNPTDNPPCTTLNGACLNGAIDPPECTTEPVVETTEVNECLLIEQNPITFTPEEKARLAVLLRRFYLISSTLRTEEDITTIYNEIDQQKNFMAEVEELTAQCYTQVDMGTNPEWVRHGNPWYQNQTGGTFPYTNDVRGYYPPSLPSVGVPLENSEINDLVPSTETNSFTEKILKIW